MKAKWYFSTLVVALVSLGIYQHKISSPNQEILLQYNPDEVTTEQSQTAIEAITEQLQIFGIDDVRVHQTKNGELRISYHSSIAVENIKKALSEKSLQLEIASLNHNNSKNPSKNQEKDYQLDVYEIHKTSDSSNSAGKFVVVVKQDYDRYLNSNFYPSFNQFQVNEQTDFENTSNKMFTSLSIVKDNNSYIIPEVRAGPVFSTIS